METDGVAAETPDAKPAAEAQKAPVRKWEVRKFKSGYAVLLMETAEGREPVPVKSTGVLHADIEGADIEAVVRVCDRFDFRVSALVDECRMSDSLHAAQAKCEELNGELAKETAKETA